jgi:penicillin V acylase-like amidase (Ntn superfamily)
MCTSLTLTTKSKEHFLARTMDFGFQLEGRPVYIPRNYTWKQQNRCRPKKRFLGFVGTGRNLGEYFF